MKKALILTLALLLAVPSIVLASGDVIGTFGIASAPQIDDIRVYVSDGINPAQFLTPLQDYIIEIDISDADGIGSVDKFVVKLWYDDDGGEVSGTDMNSITNYRADEMVEIYWWRSTGTLAFTGAQGTWELDTENAVLPDSFDDGMTGICTIKVPVTIGKIARHTTGDARWQIGVMVEDDYSILKAYDYFFTGSHYGMLMDWYGEIIVNPGVEVDWGNVPAGIDYSSNNAEQILSGEVSYLSNGYYHEQVKADSQWSKVDASETKVDLVTDFNDNNQFGLRVGDDSDSNNANQVSGSFIEVRQNVTWAEYNTDLMQEVANVADDYHMFIKLHSEFDTGFYSGNITFGIANPLN